LRAVLRQVCDALVRVIPEVKGEAKQKYMEAQKTGAAAHAMRPPRAGPLPRIPGGPSARTRRVPLLRRWLGVCSAGGRAADRARPPPRPPGKSLLVVVPFETGEFYQEQLAREEPMIFAELEKE